MSLRWLLFGFLFFGMAGAGASAQSRLGTWRAVGLGPDDAGFLDWAGPAAVAPDGSVVVAGPFVAEVGAVESGVARWDGERWHPLGAPPNATVTAVAVTPDGTVIVAGRFTEIGGVEASGAAKWDGAAWHELGSGLEPSSYVSLSAGPSGSVVAAGGFTTAGGVPAAGGARWTGEVWEALPDASAQIRSAIFGGDGHLYATIRPGSGPVQVVRRSGTMWEPLPAQPAELYEPLVAEPAGVFVSRSVTAAGTLGFLRWTGSAWVELEGVPNAGGTCVLAVSPEGDLFATAWGAVDATPREGDVLATAKGTSTANPPDCSRLWRYRDGGWTHIGDAFGVSTAVGVPGGVVATGRFHWQEGRRAEGVARYAADGWHPLGRGLSPDGSVTGLYALPAGGAVATGTFSRIGTTPARGIARWDGNSWHPLGDGVETESGTAGGVSDVAIASDGRLVAVGSFVRAGGVVAPGIAAWDGAAWSALPALGVGRPAAATFAADGALVVAGSRRAADAVYSTVLRLDGGAWTQLGDSLRGESWASVYTLRTGLDGSQYASGVVRAAGAEPARNVVRWDGTAWRAVGAFSGEVVSDLVFSPDGRPVAVGPGVPRTPTAGPGAYAWDGAAWGLLGGPFTGWLTPGVVTTVSAASLDAQGAIVVAGNFTAADGVPAHGLAWWNGKAWTGTGDGPDGFLSAVAPTADDDVLVAGGFARAGGRPAPRIAMFETEAVTTVPDPQGVLTLSVGPNPASGNATAWLTGTGPVRLEVTDALGRRVAIPFDSHVAGRFAVPLPSALASGVYAVRVVSGIHARTVRWVVIR